MPSCGSETVVHGPGKNIAARECFWDAYLNQRPAEFISTLTTIEGDPVTWVYRTAGGGGVEIFIDSTEDTWGFDGWTRMLCDRLSLDPNSPTIEFAWNDCAEEQLG